LELALIVVLAVATHRSWFLSLEPLAAGDLLFLHDETSLDYFSLAHSWTDTACGGTPNARQITHFVFKFVFGLMIRAGFSFEVTERVLWFWPSALLPVFSMYHLMSRLFSRRTALRGLPSLLFAFNTYYLIIQTNHLLIAVAYALTPSALAFFIDALRHRTLRKALIAGLTLGGVWCFDPRVGYAAVLLLGFYLAYHLLIGEQPSERPGAWKTLRIAGVVFLITGLTQSYWILMFPTGLSESVDALMPSKPWLSLMTILHSFALHHPFWTMGELVYFEIQPTPAYVFSFPLLALSVMLLKNKPRRLSFFALVGLLGVFLVKQENPPLATIYGWLFSNVPGFHIFRDASKFYLFIALSYSVLLGYVLGRIHTYLESRKAGAVLSYGLRLACLVPILLLVKPAMTGELGFTFETAVVPEEYMTLKAFFLSQPANSFRSLWMPERQRFAFFSEAYPPLSLVSRFFDSGLPGGLPIYTTHPHQAADGPLFRPLLHLSSVKYVILPFDSESELYTYAGKKHLYVSSLDALPWLEKLDITSDIVVYEAESFTPHICAAPAAVLVDASHEDTLTMLNYTPHLQHLSCPALIAARDITGTEVLVPGVAEVVVGPLPEAESPSQRAIASLPGSPHRVSYLPAIPQDDLVLSQTGDYLVRAHVTPRAWWEGPPDTNAVDVTLEATGSQRAAPASAIQLALELPKESLDQPGYWTEPQEVYLEEGAYHLQTSQPHAFEIRLLEIASGSYQPAQHETKIAFHKIDPTRYEIQVETEEPFWLVFSESYHPGWHAYIEESSPLSEGSTAAGEEERSQVDVERTQRPWYEQSAILNRLVQRRSRSDLTEHYLVNTYANGWYVGQTGAYTITLEYVPQQVFEVGVLISLTTVVGCIGYLGWDWHVKRRDTVGDRAG
jgi:hypothetical protein